MAEHGLLCATPKLQSALLGYTGNGRIYAPHRRIGKKSNETGAILLEPETMT